MLLALPLFLLLLAAPVVAEAEPAGKVYRIGVLANALATSDGPTFLGFLEALKGLGYVQGRNMDIEWRSSEGETGQLPGLAMELLRAKVDIIFATGLQPALAAEEATKTVPIVFVVAADPVGQRLVQSLARPGGNATGVSAYVPQESADKALQSLRAVMPSLTRLAVLNNPRNPAQRELLAGPLPAAARRAGIVLLSFPVESAGELAGAFDAAQRERAQAMYVLGDVLTFVQRTRIAELAVKHRLPAIYTTRGAVEAGGLMAYGPNLRELFRRAAAYVDKILKGSSPSALAVESSSRYELIVNVKTAKQLGLAVPVSLLKQAALVIE